MGKGGSDWSLLDLRLSLLELIGGRMVTTDYLHVWVTRTDSIDMWFKQEINLC